LHTSVPDPANAIARTWAADVALPLDRERLAFLSGIHAFLELNSDPMLGEAELRDVFALRIAAPHLRSVDAGLQDPAHSRLFLARLLLRVEHCTAAAVGLADAIGPLDQWVARDHAALLAD
jgi:chromosome condensin MukBEF complex kleisin-like MukF subunit